MDQILRAIDKATEPGLMTKQEALNFLQQIQAELAGRCEALREEIAEA